MYNGDQVNQNKILKIELTGKKTYTHKVKLYLIYFGKKIKIQAKIKM